MSKATKADWAALCPWDGVQGKPSFVEGPNGNITIADVRGLQAALDSKQSAGGLARVAYTGSYTDLNNRPAFGSAAFANVTDFMAARTPRRWQMAEFAFIAGYDGYDVFFSEEMSDIPTVKVQVLIDDATSGESFFAVVEQPLITTTGFRVWLSGVPSVSAGRLRWWAEVETSFGGSVDPVVPPDPSQPELGVWEAGVIAGGGTFEADSVDIARDLLTELKGKAYYSKIIYLLPLLGSNLAAARMPLIDMLVAGMAGNSGFVDGDFSQATGLQGNGSSKVLDSLIFASQLGVSNNGGLGYIENNYNGSGTATELMGAYNNALTARFELDVRAASLRFFSWGNPSNRPEDAVAGSNGHYYGQRSSATDRRFFINGAQAALSPNVVNDAGTGSSERTILFVGVNSPTVFYNAGRCACAYMTDGTLTDGDVADLYSTLQTWLITPTGRP